MQFNKFNGVWLTKMYTIMENTLTHDRISHELSQQISIFFHRLTNRLWRKNRAYFIYRQIYRHLYLFSLIDTFIKISCSCEMSIELYASVICILLESISDMWN